MTLFVTSHTAKRYKMKATACKKEGIKQTNLSSSRNISPFVLAVKAQLLTEYWSHFHGVLKFFNEIEIQIDLILIFCIFKYFFFTC